MRFIYYINALRLASFLISLVAFACHVAQCILFGAYRAKTNIPDWLPAGHWQYLLWYISLSMSLLGSSALCLYVIYIRYRKKTLVSTGATIAHPTVSSTISRDMYSIDKWIGIISFLPIFCSTITVLAANDPSLLEPWTNNLVKLERTPFALFSSCYALNATVDQDYPLLFRRCVLGDTLWVLAILLCILWSLLVCFAFWTTSKRTSDTSRAFKHIHSSFASVDHHRSGMIMSLHNTGVGIVEPNWGRYLPDPPSTMYSAATLNSRTGLLTPISTLTQEKHLEFYAKCQKEYYEAGEKTDYYHKQYDNKHRKKSSYHSRASDEKRKLQQYYGNDISSPYIPFNDSRETTLYTNWTKGPKNRISSTAGNFRAPSPLKEAYCIGQEPTIRTSNSQCLQHAENDSNKRRKPSNSMSKEQLLHSLSQQSSSPSENDDANNDDKVVESLTVSGTPAAMRTPLYSKFSAKRSQDFNLLF